MDVIQDVFCCSACRNENFRQIYGFSIVFHTVNFTDELIYDKVTRQSYECTKCGKIYSNEEIEETLREFKKERRGKD
jgi:hypothetical protein